MKNQEHVKISEPSEYKLSRIDGLNSTLSWEGYLTQLSPEKWWKQLKKILGDLRIGESEKANEIVRSNSLFELYISKKQKF